MVKRMSPRTEAGAKALSQMTKGISRDNAKQPRPESLVLLERITNELETLDGYVTQDRETHLSAAKALLRRVFFEVEAVETDLQEARYNEERLSALALQKLT